MLVGLPKAKQLEMLKGLMALPDDKLMSQIPQLANAHDMPRGERVALSRELGSQLIAELEEDEGVRYELPPGFVPVGAPLQPPPSSQRPDPR